MEKESLEIKTDSKKVILVGLFLIFGVFGVIVGWAVFSKVDTTVVVQGKVLLDNYKKPVEYKDWAILHKVYVKEGDFVKAGDTLFEVEKMEDKTMEDINKFDYYTLLAKRDRLMAEKNMMSSVVFTFQQNEDKQIVDKIKDYQIQVFNQRKEKLDQQLRVLDERIRQLKQQIEDNLNLKQFKLEQLNQYQAALDQESRLLSQGLSTKDRVLDLQEKVDNIKTQIKNLDIEINQAYLRIEENIKQKDLAIKDYTSTAANELQDVIRSINEAMEKMKLYSKKVERALIRTDIEGQVIGVKLYYPGQVIKPGDVVMYIVPIGNRIVIDGVLLPKDRDKVRVGMEVNINFPSFISLAAKNIKGKVVFVSDDTVYDEGLKHDIYKIKIEVTPEGYETIRKNRFEITSGMPAVSFVKVEKVRPIDYILQPILMMFKSSFSSN